MNNNCRRKHKISWNYISTEYEPCIVCDLEECTCIFIIVPSVDSVLNNPDFVSRMARKYKFTYVRTIELVDGSNAILITDTDTFVEASNSYELLSSFSGLKI